MSEGYVALIAALFGGAGLKIIEYVLNKSKRRSDVATQIRDELRQETQQLKREVDALEAALDIWKNRYYILIDALSYAKSILISLGRSKEVDTIEDKISKATIVLPVHKPPEEE